MHLQLHKIAHWHRFLPRVQRIPRAYGHGERLDHAWVPSDGQLAGHSQTSRSWVVGRLGTYDHTVRAHPPPIVAPQPFTD
ncbi:MAG TPA: hypothetical protein VME68_09855 [Acidobacteriaceae bacterium]|nr:hypothetical protein [Acidobacteriaceae bacterium]